MNHSKATTPASVIATKLHFYLRFYQSGLSYSRGQKATRKNTKNTAAGTIPMRKKKDINNDRKKVSQPW